MPETIRRWSETALRWLTEQPTIKLAGFIYVAVAPIVGAWYVYSKDRQEQRRLGLLLSPMLSLSFPGQNCTLVNRDRRPVTEATLTFSTWVVDASACTISGVTARGSEWDVASSQLLPRDRLQVITDQLRIEHCGRVRDPSTCPTAHDCRLVVECEAEYLRQPDLKTFRETALALSSKDCSQLRDIGTLLNYDLKNSSWIVTWRDASDERAFKCFTRVRRTLDQVMEMDKVVRRKVRDAVDRELQR